MDDDQIKELITGLRELLFHGGFGWVAVDAEEGLYPTVAPRTRALALIRAAEIVTVDLSEVEMAAYDAFGGEGIRFKPDAAAQGDGEDAFVGVDRVAVDDGAERFQGAQRRAKLADLTARRHVFEMLRSQLDGLV